MARQEAKLYRWEKGFFSAKKPSDIYRADPESINCTVGVKTITLPEKLFHQLFVCPVREGGRGMGDGGRGSVRGVSPGIMITLVESFLRQLIW